MPTWPTHCHLARIFGYFAVGQNFGDLLDTLESISRCYETQCLNTISLKRYLFKCMDHFYFSLVNCRLRSTQLLKFLPLIAVFSWCLLQRRPFLAVSTAPDNLDQIRSLVVLSQL